ncbi:hypothetical protein Zmor_003513 [Zophobas morio]|uniref:Uncharacterized protein n=1 Tax=Zophobas morio TaxID=2755281 RepID=A0AA38HSE8_9CUCU|nr:hypothetical protein Zmor_003513 [Zophobas morio]
MSKEGSPELTKSWVFVDSNEDNQLKDTSGVQEFTENEPHGDSDTDSISVISESGCSYKTDEEELTQQEVPEDRDDIIEETLEKASEAEPIKEPEPEIVKEPEVVEPVDSSSDLASEEKKRIEKLLYFATSAVCAIMLVGFSIAVQHYFQAASDLNAFDPEQQFVFSHVQNVKNEAPSKFSPKRKSLKLQELENKIAKLQEDNEFHDKITTPVRDNDLSVEETLKSNYKLNKNKNAASKCNKGNCDVNEKHAKIRDRAMPKVAENDKNDEKTQNQPHDGDTNTDETYHKKVKELKVKEDYLKQKEKFLIEKEHDLLKKEIKLNKEKEKQQYPKPKHDKKVSHKKGKDSSSEEDVSGERKDKFKSKEYPKKQLNKSNNKKYMFREERKHFPAHKRFKFSEEHNKKRNISGQWYINLHEARDNMRQKRRASFKKNKAHWYFQWMVDRARLRVK